MWWDVVLLVILALIVIIFFLVQSDPPVVRSPKPSSPAERTNWFGPSQITGYSRSHSPLVNKPATISAKNILFTRLVNEARQAQEKQRRIRRGRSHEGRLEHAPNKPPPRIYSPVQPAGFWDRVVSFMPRLLPNNAYERDPHAKLSNAMHSHQKKKNQAVRNRIRPRSF